MGWLLLQTRISRLWPGASVTNPARLPLPLSATCHVPLPAPSGSGARRVLPRGRRVARRRQDIYFGFCARQGPKLLVATHVQGRGSFPCEPGCGCPKDTGVHQKGAGSCPLKTARPARSSSTFTLQGLQRELSPVGAGKDRRCCGWAVFILPVTLLAQSTSPGFGQINATATGW